MPQLNANQQEKLSKIMSVPTKTNTQPPMGPPIGQAVPVLPSYQVVDLPNPSLNNSQVTTAVPSATSVVGSSTPPQKKSSSLMAIVLLIGGIILLGGYTYFWLIFFKII